MYRSPFLNPIAEFMLARRYSKRMIQSYTTWVKAFIQFNDKRHSDQLIAIEIKRFLTHLAVR